MQSTSRVYIKYGQGTTLTHTCSDVIFVYVEIDTALLKICYFTVQKTATAKYLGFYVGRTKEIIKFLRSICAQ
jgi:hypothetical protein